MMLKHKMLDLSNDTLKRIIYESDPTYKNRFDIVLEELKIIIV